MGTEYWASPQLYCDCVARPDRAYLDEGLAYVPMGEDGPRSLVYYRVAYRLFCTCGQVPRCRLARIMESGGKFACSELWRWKGYPLEGKLEGRLGMYQRHEQLNACLLLYYLLSPQYQFSFSLTLSVKIVYDQVQTTLVVGVEERLTNPLVVPCAVVP